MPEFQPLRVLIADDEPLAAERLQLLLARADYEAIEHALAQLPTQHREIILLCDVEEMSYREISEALTIPLGTVMSRLSRARKAMRQLLQKTLTGAKS